MLQRRRLVAGLVLVALVAAACSSGPKVSSIKARSGAHQGGTLVVGITEPGSLDPSNAYDPAGEEVLSTVCEPLIQFNPVTAKATQGGIVTGWVVSGAGSTFTVTMRNGITYQNGQKLNAIDERDELSRVASVDNASYDATLLSRVNGYEYTHGDVQTNNDNLLRYLSGIAVISNNGFSISLAPNENDASFIWTLGDLMSAPVPASVQNAASFSSKPVCAGPYKMDKAWKPGDPEVLVSRFSGYYGQNQVFPNGGIGYPARIEFKIFSDRSAEVAAFKAGQLDVAQVPESDLAQAAQIAMSSGSKLVSAANGYVEYVGFPNAGTSAFVKPAVHQALSEALDRPAIAAAAYGGGSLPATGFIPPTVGEVYSPNQCAASPATANVAAAQATLAKAGVNLSGKALTFYYDTGNQNAQLAQAIAAEWQQAFGLKVTLKAMDWNSYETMANGSSGFGPDGAFLEGWSSPFPSADNYITPLFSSTSVGTDNFAHYVNANFDRVLLYGAQQDDDQRAVDLTTERYLLPKLCKDMPMAPIVFRQYHYLVRTSAVGSAIGTFTDAATGLPELREIYIKS